MAKQVGKAFRNRKMQKDESDSVTDGLDLIELEALIDVSPAALKSMMQDGGTRSLAQLGVGDNSELVNQVYDEAVDYSTVRSAELIGKKYINGKLVDNPNAEWSIPDATRDELRGIISDAFAGNIPANDVEAAIANAGSFSDERAALIARTEISRANNYGSLSGYKAARERAGLDVKKSWYPDAEACPICLDNADDGAIDLDEQFSSGDDAPPAHPNCECTLIPITGAEANDDAE